MWGEWHKIFLIFFLNLGKPSNKIKTENSLVLYIYIHFLYFPGTFLLLYMWQIEVTKWDIWNNFTIAHFVNSNCPSHLTCANGQGGGTSYRLIRRIFKTSYTNKILNNEKMNSITIMITYKLLSCTKHNFLVQKVLFFTSCLPN